MRIFAASDLHTDFRENLLLLRGLSDVAYRGDALVVAGDVADRLGTIRATLSLLRDKFRHVFYTPGNHELWVRHDDCDSVEKFHRVIELCGELGVQTGPAEVSGVRVVPLFSWYEPGFDAGGEGAEDAQAQLEAWADFYFCRWPEGFGPVPEFFLGLNEPRLAPHAPSVSFSHFLPRRDLLPATEHLRFKGLPKVSGCASLEAQIRRLMPAVHVFGHSHINCDRVVDGVRYVQNALRYPRERTARPAPPLKMVWDTDAEQEARPLAACTDEGAA